MIRSISNKIKKINFENFQNNYKLNFNFKNLNIINGHFIEDKEKNVYI